MNRKEINQALGNLNLGGLLIGYKEGATPEDYILAQQEAHACGDELAFSITAMPNSPWHCQGTAEGADPDVAVVFCGEPAHWAVESESDDWPELYCTACVLEKLGPNGDMKVIAGEVTIDSEVKE